MVPVEPTVLILFSIDGLMSISFEILQDLTSRKELISISNQTSEVSVSPTNLKVCLGCQSTSEHNLE